MSLCNFSKTWVTVDINARSVGACCRTTHIDVADKIDINNDWFKSLRSNLSADIKDIRCDACWKQEKSIGTSLRLNGPYTIKSDDSLPLEADLQYLEIRLGNQCDGACVYCGGMFSNKQAKFWKIHLDIEKPVSKPPMVDEVKELIINNSHSLRQIVFLGGEPSLMESWYQFLDFLADAEFKNKVTVIVTSNCNWTDKIKKRFFSSIEKFLGRGGNFEIRVSGEGDRKYFNGIRKYSDYDTVISNVESMVSTFENRISYTLQPVLNGLSSYGMTSWLKTFADIFSRYNVKSALLNFALLTRPEELATIHQGTRAISSLEDIREYLQSTDMFQPKKRMTAVLDSQLSLLVNEPNIENDEKIKVLLQAHDDIMKHDWKSVDAIP